MKFSKRAIGRAGTIVLLAGVGTVTAGAQSGPMPATAKTTCSGTTALGLVDVEQCDLEQNLVKDNWVSYNGDDTGRRYSGLSEVTPANVSQLGAKWIFHFKNGAGIVEVTPVVVNGVMFIVRGNDAYALDAQTGKQLWHYARAASEGLINNASTHINRGVAVLGTRVYMGTDNAHLICLDGRSGNLIWDRLYVAGNKNYGSTGAPIIVKNLVVVGSSGGDEGVRGFVAAFNAQTGNEVWRFWTIPAPGEFGSESWPGDMWKHGGGATWVPGTYDPELNTIYWGTGNPSPDYWGSLRPGDDLYTDSLLALDADTGKLKWYFQFTRHDLHDYDAVQTPVLVDTNFDGQPRKLVITVNKNGFLYILDRTNGKYLYSKQFLKFVNWTSGIDETGHPISNNLVPDDKGVMVCPDDDGGTNWYSPSYDPATNSYYFRSTGACGMYKAKPDPFAEGHAWFATGEVRTEEKVPSPNVASINAFDLDKRDFAWRDPLIGPERTMAGVMTTAGGLVAFGNDAQEFQIDDVRTGKPLWAFNLGQPMRASPMSYGIHGKQYFAVAAGDNVIAFALP